MEPIKSKGRGGRRAGAGRPKGSKTRHRVQLSGLVNPIEILEAICLDETAPHAARVAAARTLLERGRPPEKAPKPHPHADSQGIVWLKRSGENV